MAKALRVILTFVLAVVSEYGFLPLLRAQSLDVVPIDVSVLNPPIVFKADGRWDMAYELRISSLADVGDTTITNIQLLDPNGKPLVDISGDALKGCLDPGAAVGPSNFYHRLHVGECQFIGGNPACAASSCDGQSR